MNIPAFALFATAALQVAASFDIPEKKQKNPGIAASERQDQSHDVHELEKISFTVTGVSPDRPGGVTYLKIAADYDADGKADTGYLRLVCTGGAASDIQAWSWGESHSGMGPPPRGQGHGRAVPGIPAQWSPPSPPLAALTATYLAKKLSRLGDKRVRGHAGGWTRVSLSGAEGLCPAAAAASSSRSNIKNN
jgi:hypothetical protein